MTNVRGDYGSFRIGLLTRLAIEISARRHPWPSEANKRTTINNDLMNFSYFENFLSVPLFCPSPLVGSHYSNNKIFSVAFNRGARPLFE